MQVEQVEVDGAGGEADGDGARSVAVISLVHLLSQFSLSFSSDYSDTHALTHLSRSINTHYTRAWYLFCICSALEHLSPLRPPPSIRSRYEE